MTKTLDVSKGLVKAYPLRLVGMTTLAQRVRELLDEKGWTHEEAAKRAGLNKSHIGALLGGTDPRLSTALNIARAFGVTLQWLATGEGPRDERDAVAHEALRRAAHAILAADDRKSTIRTKPPTSRK